MRVVGRFDEKRRLATNPGQKLERARLRRSVSVL